MADEVANLHLGTKYLQTLKPKVYLEPSEVIMESRVLKHEAEQRNSRSMSLTSWPSYEHSVCLFKLNEHIMEPC